MSTAGTTGTSARSATAPDDTMSSMTGSSGDPRTAQPHGAGDTTRSAGPAHARRVKLTVSRVDPWSAMKMAFLISVALGVAGVIMVAVLWMILSGMGVFSQVNNLVAQVIQDSRTPFNLMDFLGFGRVLSLSVVIGVIDVILMTALSTLGAFLYNICSSLVGGLQLTLTDD